MPPALPRPPLTYVPRCHIHTAANPSRDGNFTTALGRSSQAWTTLCVNKFFPNFSLIFQPKPPLVYLEAIFSWDISTNCWILAVTLTPGSWEDILLCTWTMWLFFIFSLENWATFSSSWALFGLLFSALFCAYSGAALANALSVVSMGFCVLLGFFYLFVLTAFWFIPI